MERLILFVGVFFFSFPFCSVRASTDSHEEQLFNRIERALDARRFVDSSNKDEKILGEKRRAEMKSRLASAIKSVEDNDDPKELHAFLDEILSNVTDSYTCNAIMEDFGSLYAKGDNRKKTRELLRLRQLPTQEFVQNWENKTPQERKEYSRRVAVLEKAGIGMLSHRQVNELLWNYYQPANEFDKDGVGKMMARRNAIFNEFTTKGIEKETLEKISTAMSKANPLPCGESMVLSLSKWGRYADLKKLEAEHKKAGEEAAMEEKRHPADSPKAKEAREKKEKNLAALKQIWEEMKNFERNWDLFGMSTPDRVGKKLYEAYNAPGTPTQESLKAGIDSFHKELFSDADKGGRWKPTLSEFVQMQLNQIKDESLSENARKAAKSALSVAMRAVSQIKGANKVINIDGQELSIPADTQELTNLLSRYDFFDKNKIIPLSGDLSEPPLVGKGQTAEEGRKIFYVNYWNPILKKNRDYSTTAEMIKNYEKLGGNRRDLQFYDAKKYEQYNLELENLELKRQIDALKKNNTPK